MDPPFFSDVRDAFLTELASIWRDSAHADPMLGTLRRVVYEHGTTTEMVDVSGVLRTSNMQAIGTGFELPVDAIAKGDIVAFRRAVADSVVEFKRQATNQLIATMERATAETGNIVDLRGAPLTGRVLCDMVEQMEISFDRRGQPVMPTLMIHPDLEPHVRQLLERPEVQVRMDMILREKWLQRFSLRAPAK